MKWFKMKGLRCASSTGAENGYDKIHQSHFETSQRSEIESCFLEQLSRDIRVE